MSLKKSMYEHLKTKKKYNLLDINYKELNQRYEEKIIELEEQKRCNREIKKKFDNEYAELLKKYLELKVQLKELKKRKRVKKNEQN